MSKLYEINEKFLDLIQNGIDFETGEVFFTQDQLDELDLEFNKKMNNVSKYVQSLKLGIENFEKEIARMKKNIERDTKQIIYFQNYMLYSMQIRDLKMLKTDNFQLSTRKSQSVSILDELSIPDEFKKVVETTKIEKMKIKESIKNGVDVPGAEIKENVSLTIK